MVIFGVKAPDLPIITDYMSATNNRLQSQNMVKNPFYGRVVLIKRVEGFLYYCIEMKPIYPHFYIFGPILIVLPLLWTGLRMSWYMLLGFFWSLLGIFWSAWFYWIMLNLGLKKLGYKKNLEKVSKGAIIGLLLDNGG